MSSKSIWSFDIISKILLVYPDWAWIRSYRYRDSGTQILTVTNILENSIDYNVQIEGDIVDKHSTGGVGDKVTITLIPLLAAAGIPVAKLSGKGLGHTGGTIDKLESIPGFNTQLSIEELMSQVKKIGVAIASQTKNLTPADGKLYALRDVTSTVDSMPLIASSVVSKKIASGAKNIILDVKYGSGAFMKTPEDSVNLSKLMVKIGKLLNKSITAVITSMEEPLGRFVGNNLEISSETGNVVFDKADANKIKVETETGNINGRVPNDLHFRTTYGTFFKDPNEVANHGMYGGLWGNLGKH